MNFPFYTSKVCVTNYVIFHRPYTNARKHSVNLHYFYMLKNRQTCNSQKKRSVCTVIQIVVVYTSNTDIISFPHYRAGDKDVIKGSPGNSSNRLKTNIQHLKKIIKRCLRMFFFSNFDMSDSGFIQLHIFQLL